MKKLSERLAWARKQKGWNQKELAKLVGITPAAISNAEQGTRETVREIVKLAEVLGVSAAWLASGKGSAGDCIDVSTQKIIEANPVIQAVIDLMNSTDEKGKLEILSRSQDIWELREAHLRSIGQSHAENERQRLRHAELNKLSHGFNADFVSRTRHGDQ